MGERLAGESRVVDCANTRGDPHAGHLRTAEGVRADLGHPLGDAHLCCATRVRHEDAVVDGEPIGIGAQRGGSIDLTECARVGRERGRDTYPGQGQGAGERKRQHN